MIEVLCSTGDRTEAECPESALVAARQMMEDHWQASPSQGRGRDLMFSFLVAGEVVRVVEGKEIRYGRA